MKNLSLTATSLIAAIFFLLPGIAKAEYFRHLTLGEGLSQPSVMAISQDRVGRMWLGTREGVNVFDGKSITVYKGWVENQSRDGKVWIGNEVEAIVSDSVGDMYMLIDNNLVKYDLVHDNFTRLTSSGNINALAENRGRLYLLPATPFL